MTCDYRGFVDKMKSSNRRMVVFYGSQTGTAEEFAGRLAKEGARYGCKVGEFKQAQSEIGCVNSSFCIRNLHITQSVFTTAIK